MSFQPCIVQYLSYYKICPTLKKILWNYTDAAATVRQRKLRMWWIWGGAGRKHFEVVGQLNAGECKAQVIIIVNIIILIIIIIIMNNFRVLITGRRWWGRRRNWSKRFWILPKSLALPGMRLLPPRSPYIRSEIARISQFHYFRIFSQKNLYLLKDGFF